MNPVQFDTAAMYARLMAVVDLLIRKGVFTEDDYARNVARKEAAVDQMSAEIREEWERQNPGFAEWLEKFQ